MLLKIFFADLQTLLKCIRVYGSLNISRLKFLLITLKTAKPAEIFSLEIFRLYGMLLVPPCLLNKLDNKIELHLLLPHALWHSVMVKNLFPLPWHPPYVNLSHI